MTGVCGNRRGNRGLPTAAVFSTAKLNRTIHMEALMNIHRYRGIGWRRAVLRRLAGLDQADAVEKAGVTPKPWRMM